MENGGALEYWTHDERGHLATHIKKQMRKIKKFSKEKKLPILLSVVPEEQFITNGATRSFKGSTQDGWSIWIRETFVGIPFTYGDYLKTALHEFVHCYVTQTYDKYVYGDSDPLFIKFFDRFEREAEGLSILGEEGVPEEVGYLFEKVPSRGLTLSLWEKYSKEIREVIKAIKKSFA